MREWTLWKESQVKKLREGKNSSSYTNISQWGESSFLTFLFWKKNQWIWKKLYIMWLFILQKRNEKTFCRVKSRIILCVECYGAWLGAIFIFAFCESWKSRRSSLFSRDANKESLLWKLNGAQKLIEPEDTILSKSSKDIFYYNYYNILKMPFSWQEWIFSPEFT